MVRPEFDHPAVQLYGSYPLTNYFISVDKNKIEFMKLKTEIHT